MHRLRCGKGFGELHSVKFASTSYFPGKLVARQWPMVLLFVHFLCLLMYILVKSQLGRRDFHISRILSTSRDFYGASMLDFFPEFAFGKVRAMVEIVATEAVFEG